MSHCHRAMSHGGGRNHESPRTMIDKLRRWWNTWSWKCYKRDKDNIHLLTYKVLFVIETLYATQSSNLQLKQSKLESWPRKRESEILIHEMRKATRSGQWRCARACVLTCNWKDTWQPCIKQQTVNWHIQTGEGVDCTHFKGENVEK